MGNGPFVGTAERLNGRTRLAPPITRAHPHPTTERPSVDPSQTTRTHQTDSYPRLSSSHSQDTYSNKSWCIVAQQMFALKEVVSRSAPLRSVRTITPPRPNRPPSQHLTTFTSCDPHSQNQMEREMLGYLEWNVVVSGEEIAGLDETLRTKFGPSPAAPPTPATPSLLAPFPSTPAIHIAPASAAHAYPSPPSSPIALSTSASSESSPASSLGEPCATPPDAAPGGYEAAKKVFEGRHRSSAAAHDGGVVTKVVERGGEEEEEEMDGVSAW